MNRFHIITAFALISCGSTSEEAGEPNGGTDAGDAGSSVGGAGGSVGGAGGSGGTPGCCSDVSECSGGDVCHNSVCRPPPTDGRCWSGTDCAVGTCLGAIACGCNFEFCDPDELGWCGSPPAPGSCCHSDDDCGDGVCVKGVCKETLTGACWNHDECPTQFCVGVSVCPCGAECGTVDQPGECL